MVPRTSTIIIEGLHCIICSWVKMTQHTSYVHTQCIMYYVSIVVNIPPVEDMDGKEPCSDCSDVAMESGLGALCVLGWSDTMPLLLSSVSLDVVI